MRLSLLCFSDAFCCVVHHKALLAKQHSPFRVISCPPLLHAGTADMIPAQCASHHVVHPRPPFGTPLQGICHEIDIKMQYMEVTYPDQVVWTVTNGLFRHMGPILSAHDAKY